MQAFLYCQPRSSTLLLSDSNGQTVAIIKVRYPALLAAMSGDAAKPAVTSQIGETAPSSAPMGTVEVLLAARLPVMKRPPMSLRSACAGPLARAYILCLVCMCGCNSSINSQFLVS